MDKVISTDELMWNLAQIRPDRYDPVDLSWAADLAQELGGRYRPSDARTILGMDLIRTAQRTACRAAITVMRDVGLDNRWPEIWGDYYGALPLVIDASHVCLRAATFHDLQKWELGYRRRAAKQFAAQNTACDGAQWLIKQVPENRWSMPLGGAMFDHATSIEEPPEAA